MLTYPKQTTKCLPCEGCGRVATINAGSDIVLRLVGAKAGKPLPMTVTQARKKLQSYRAHEGERQGSALEVLVRSLATNVDTMSCPWCDGTGSSGSVQQLTHEEASALCAEKVPA